MRTLALSCLAILGFAPNIRADLYLYTGSIQEYTVLTTGVYHITVAGAQGGLGRDGIAGLGASLSGDVTLTAGTVLEIVVGGQGESMQGPNAEGGGGGGSFVYIAGATQPLIVAGGGGGGGVYALTYGVSGGQITTSGANATAPTAGSGGTGGQGGGGGVFVQGQNGGGGGGWLSGGTAGYTAPPYYYSSGAGGSSPPTFTGGAGGNIVAGSGGYGGGGGAGGSGGGGGGGYSGGGGAGAYGGSGGGGGSYLDSAFTSTVMTANVQTGNGAVAINSPVPVPEPAGIILIGTGLAGLVIPAAWNRRKPGTAA